MNIDNGRIVILDKILLDKLGIEVVDSPEEMLIKNRLVEIENDMMTDKQSELMQVSKYDNKSNLGRLFLENRNKVRNQLKNSKNKH